MRRLWTRLFPAAQARARSEPVGAPESRHPHDISDGDLAAMCALSPDRDRLMDVVKQSRRTIGFFPAHNPRALEYPWIVSQLESSTRGARVLDVGAGVNVLPFLLAERGMRVTTLDNHPATRDPSARQAWNEWGFLDYGLLDSRIRSVRSPYEAWQTHDAFDAIYSVSVIEHVPRDVRLRWIAKFAEQLRPGGVLLLTVDLERESNRLWNLCEGKQVEDPAVHGEFATLIDELASAGFECSETDVRRGIPNCRVDIGFVRAKRR